MKTTIFLAVLVLLMGFLAGFFWPIITVVGGAVCLVFLMFLEEAGVPHDSVEEKALVTGMIAGLAVGAFGFVVTVYTSALALMGAG